MIACCLLMGVLCASFAEETADFPVDESNRVTIEESAAIEVPADPVEDREEADAPSIPEMNGEPAETEPEPQAGKTAVIRAWITEKQGENEAVILKANVKPALEGKVTWQVHNENWQEDKWEEIGNGEQITLDSAKVSNGSLVRFLLEDGTVSETYEVTITKQEEPAAEEPITEESVTEEPTAEEPVTEEPTSEEPVTEDPATEEPITEGTVTEEPGTDGTSAGEAVTEEPATEETPAEKHGEEAGNDEGFAEEPGEPVTLRAWITGNENAQAGETVTLSANAEPELTGVSTWQIRNEQVENGKWKRAGYGDHLTVELAEGSEYRFVMQDGTVSEVLKLANAPEETTEENAGEAGTAEGTADAGETMETEEPDEESGDAGQPGDEAEESGDEAEGNGAEPEDELIEETGETEGTETPAETEETGETGVLEETGEATESEEEPGETAEPEDEPGESAEPEDEPGEAAEPEDEPGEAAEPEEEPGEAAEPEDEPGETPEENGEPGEMEEAGEPEETGEPGETEETETDGEPEEEPAENSETEESGEAEEPAAEEPTEEEPAEEEPADEEPAEAEESSEDAEEETPEEKCTLPEDRSAVISISWDEEQPGIGSVAHFSAQLTGYEELNYTVQWIVSTDNENWTDVEGATGETMDVVVTEDNYMNYWRIRVHIEGFKDIQ